MSSNAHRMPVVDACKALASQLVLFHHLASYGPLAHAMEQWAPALSAWLFEYARMAVQIFLVLGGFLAVRALSPDGNGLNRFPWHGLGKRYLRLVLPFIAALALAIMASALADQLMDDEAIPARAQLGQWLAHVFLLHGVLGVESLSAGVWYVAIDFQLYILLAMVLTLGRAHRVLAVTLVALMVFVSLLWWNRDAAWDNWALYFFGAYGLGALSWWAARQRHAWLWMGALVCLVVFALTVDFRIRGALALATALLLVAAQRYPQAFEYLAIRPVAYLAQISYAVFLVHFPVILLVNGAFSSWVSLSPQGMLLGWGLTWCASLWLGGIFYRWVESPEASRRIHGALSEMFLLVWRPLGRVGRKHLSVSVVPSKARTSASEGRPV